MFKKTMKFDDLDGNPVTQTFYFNYNKKEIAELMEFGYLTEFQPADPSRRLPLEKQLEILSTPVEESGLSQTDNNKVAYDIFQDLILDAYGVKGADNVSFDKTPALRHYWSTHVAFVEMIFEFLESPALGAEFIEKCLPPKLVESAKKEMQKENDGKLSEQGLADMMEEANRRQQDPATRIEPGLDAAREALGESPVIEQLAQSIAGQEGPVPVAPEEDGGTKAKLISDLTEEDIMEMDDLAFKKLDIKKLSKELLIVAFRRKSGN